MPKTSLCQCLGLRHNPKLLVWTAVRKQIFLSMLLPKKLPGTHRSDGKLYYPWKAMADFCLHVAACTFLAPAQSGVTTEQLYTDNLELKVSELVLTPIDSAIFLFSPCSYYWLKD